MRSGYVTEYFKGHEDKKPCEKLCDITRSHTMHLEAILKGKLGPKQKAERLYHASNNFTQALRGVLFKEIKNGNNRPMVEKA